MLRKEIAQQTLKILQQGGYEAPSGAWIDLSHEEAVAGTLLYRPADFPRPVSRRDGPTCVEIAAETTGQTAQRLAHEPDVAALNFASARNPGGGFIGGATAQEEDLALCSALYPCLLKQPEYYAKNRAWASMLYTHHLIYSPRVPFFRDHRMNLVEQPYRVSILTSPAPNAGHVNDSHAIEKTLRERAGHVLQVAAEQGCRTLILGAWGCGVFRNDPDLVAQVFYDLLPQFNFEHVVFAIPESKTNRNLDAFRRCFDPLLHRTTPRGGMQTARRCDP